MPRTKPRGSIIFEDQELGFRVEVEVPKSKKYTFDIVLLLIWDHYAAVQSRIIQGKYIICIHNMSSLVYSWKHTLSYH